MSTIPGFPNATTVETTDTLWITRASLGAGRDLEATVAQVGEAGHKSLALPDATSVAATDKLFLVQGTGASKDKMCTALDLVEGVIPLLGDAVVSSDCRVVLDQD